MGARDYWDRMLVYFGIAEEDEVEDGALPRRGAASQSDRRDDEWGGGEPPARRPAPSDRRRSSASRPSRPGGSSQSVAGVGVVMPRSFNDAQQIADQLKDGSPVIINLQQTGQDLARRIIDFASGLTYALDGAMKPIADRVFLLTPADVEVSSEDRAALLESGFFNQS